MKRLCEQRQACKGNVSACAPHRAPGPAMVYPSDPRRFPTVSVPLYWPVSRGKYGKEIFSEVDSPAIVIRTHSSSSQE